MWRGEGEGTQCLDYSDFQLSQYMYHRKLKYLRVDKVEEREGGREGGREGERSLNTSEWTR